LARAIVRPCCTLAAVATLTVIAATTAAVTMILNAMIALHVRYGLNINVVTRAGIDLRQSLVAAGRSASWHRLIATLGNSQY
jgi:hypothetical protein